MAIPEVCQLWVEQRVEEELEEIDETKKSYREIGREISGEIKKNFETEVSPDSIRMRVSRMRASKVKGGTNVPNEEKGGDIEEKQGDTKMEDTKSVPIQEKPYPKNTVYLEKMEQMIETGQAKTQIEAIRVIAKETGEKIANIQQKISRAKKKRLKLPLVQETERPTEDELASFSIQHSYQARGCIDRIIALTDDPFKNKALLDVFRWALAAIMREIQKGGKKWLRKNVDVSMKQWIISCLKALSHKENTQKGT